MPFTRSLGPRLPANLPFLLAPPFRRCGSSGSSAFAKGKVQKYPRSCVGCATQSPGRPKKRGAGGARGRKSCSEPGVLDPVGDQGARDPPLLLVAALTDPGLASGC